MIIKNAKDKSDHLKYSIGKINVFTDYYPTQNTDSLDSVQIDGIGLFRELDDFIVNPNSISNAISIKPGEAFSKEKMQRSTQDYQNLQFTNSYRLKLNLTP